MLHKTGGVRYAKKSEPALSLAQQETFTIQPKKVEGPLSGLTHRARVAYYQYEVTFALYVMTPVEKLILNLFLVIVGGLLLLGIVFYLPQSILRVWHRGVWLYTGIDDHLLM
jgi:hypothetical protein